MAIRLRTGHTHGLVRFTSVNLQHRHLVLAISDRPVLLSNGEHVHRVRTLTTFNRAHAHAVSRFSGEDVEIPGTNMHYHPVRARTTLNNAHRHELVARSRPAPNIPANVVRRALTMM